MNRQAESAQMESEDVAEVRVLRIGANAMSVKNTRIAAFTVFSPETTQGKIGSSLTENPYGDPKDRDPTTNRCRSKSPRQSSLR